MRISKKAPEFWSNLYGDVREIVSDAFGNLASAGAVGSGGVRLTERGEAYDSSAELTPYLSKREIAVGDTVIYLRLEDGSKVVLGSIPQVTEPATVLAGDAWLPQGDANTGVNSVTATNSSGATWATALTCNVSGLPTGTYKAIGHGVMIAQHSAANGSTEVRLRADGSNTVNGTIKALKIATAAATDGTIAMFDVLTGITRVGTGSIQLTLEYRVASPAGTITTRAPAVSVILWRTA